MALVRIAEVTFRKRFRIREDQDPAEVGRLYIETMGFEVIDTKVTEEDDGDTGAAQK